MKKWYQLTIIIMIIIIMGICSSFEDYIEREEKFFHNIITDQGKTIQTLEKKNKENKEKYHTTLVRIAENIKRNDSFLNIGGYNEDLPYDEEQYYEKILSGSSDYDTLLKNVDNFFSERSDYLENIPNIWPIKQSPYNRITSEFGKRFNPFNGKITQHNGIDIAGLWKAEVVATADGIVTEHWIFHREFGRLIIIDHDNGYKTAYAHLAVSYIHEGYRVERGDVIGLMGQSGTARGMHLHYEIRKDGVAVDPINFLRSQIE